MSVPKIDEYLTRVFELGVSKQTLRWMHTICSRHSKVALVGWSDYAKHLINLLPDTITCVVDNDPEFQGINFRGKVVVSVEDAAKPDAFLVTRYDCLVEYEAPLRAKHQFSPYLYPRSFGDDQAEFMDPYHHDPLFRAVLGAGKSPPTMMQKERLILLIEMLRVAAKRDGVVVEIGTWQGGSSWHICQTLHQLGDSRPAYFFDLFDDVKADSGRGIISLEEVRRKLAFYSPAKFHQGDVRETIRALGDERIAFAHIDNFFQKTVMADIWERLVPGGILLLDNYGHMPAHPGLFDAFFESVGEHVAFIPPLGQGLAIKR